MRTTSLLAAAAASALLGGRALAVVSVDFESTSGYTLAVDGAASSTRVTEQSNSPTHSAKFELPNTQADFAKVIVDAAPGSLRLGSASGTFSTFIPSGQEGSNYAPYMYFGVDANQNALFDFGGPNGGDSFVLAFFEPTITNDAWMSSGLDGATQVHVVGNRSGLTSGTYSSSGTQDSLSSLSALTFSGATTWGDLDILQVRVGAGETGGVLNNYTAYVDDITAVPEPSAIGLLGVGALALLRRPRRA